MASKCEDHMDLGGFLQTYVLGNPFQNPATQTVAALPSHIAAQSPGIIAQNEPTKQRVKEKSSVSQKTNLYQNHPKSSATEEKEEEQQNAGTLPGVSMETATNLGHIGSNASYANLLRKRKVADTHRPLQMWLLANYNYCPEVPAINHCLYNNQVLLQEVQSEFPTTTSIVLSRIVKFTFPNCSKIINKTGTYWLGLHRKHEDPLKEAAPEVVELTAANNKPRHGTNCAPEMQNLANGDDSPEENDSDYVSETITQAAGKRRKRKKCTPIKRHNQPYSDDEQAEVEALCNSKMIHTLLSSADVGTVSSDSRSGCVSSACGVPNGIKCDPDIAVSPCPNSDDYGDVQGHEDGRSLDSCVKVKEEPSDFSYEMCNGSDGEATREMPEQKVFTTDENENCDFENGVPMSPGICKENNVTSTSHMKANDFKHFSPNSADNNRESLALLCPDGEIPSFLICLAENRRLKCSLRSQKAKVESAVRKHQKLESDLASSREELGFLNAQLAKKDKQLRELAHEFVDLNDRFKTLSRKFQNAISASIESNENNDSLLLNMNS